VLKDTTVALTQAERTHGDKKGMLKNCGFKVQVYLIPALWHVATPTLRAVIAFVATYKAAGWHPIRVPAKWEEEDCSAYRYIPIIAAFLQPALLCKAYILWGEMTYNIIGDVIKGVEVKQVCNALLFVQHR
jgi:hypothetical protein